MEKGKIISEYVRDGTMDLKEKSVLKSKRSGWKACSSLLETMCCKHFSYFVLYNFLFIGKYGMHKELNVF